MATKTLSRTVHDGQPTRTADLKDAEWLAPAAPAPRLNDRERRIVQAHKDGADLASLVKHHHTPPAILFRILGLNPAENAELFAKLTAEFNDLRARSLR